MTRIVAGRAKGRRLAVPSKGTRPTSERAREGMFNTVAGLIDIDGARVLDLFAGSGAIGLEAASRGAGHVTCVEQDRAAASVIRANIAAVGLPDVDLVRAPAASYLVAAGADEPFDLVFADPPYAFADSALASLLGSLADPRWLRPGAVVVVERSARSDPPAWPDRLDTVKQKRYGEGVLWYGRASSPPPSGDQA